MIYINPDWTYKEVIEHIKDYKAEYQGVLSAFNMWQTKEWATYIRTTRNKFKFIIYRGNCELSK
jgi:hypothetical protein